jgi:hypothetical protein
MFSEDFKKDPLFCLAMHLLVELFKQLEGQGVSTKQIYEALSVHLVIAAKIHFHFTEK